MKTSTTFWQQEDIIRTTDKVGRQESQTENAKKLPMMSKIKNERIVCTTLKILNQGQGTPKGTNAKQNTSIIAAV